MGVKLIFDVDVSLVLTPMSESPSLSGAGWDTTCVREGKLMSSRLLPVVPFLQTPDDADPYLEGSVCARCGATFLGRRVACGKCGARDQLTRKRLSNRGTLHVYSIVHRSFPGVAVPYVSAVVDLEGGGSIKGNLIDVPPDPGHIHFGMPVEVVYREALGRTDSEGRAYLSYFFRPVQPVTEASRSQR
jgi:uncharacterized protein